MESKLEDGRRGFILVAAPRTRSLLWSKSSRNLVCMTAISLHALSVLKKLMTEVLREYGVNGQLLPAVKSFCGRPEVCVRVNGQHTKPFHLDVGLRQECVLSLLLFDVYINWINKCSPADECATIGNCKISRLLFADDLVLLSSTESGLQRALIC